MHTSHSPRRHVDPDHTPRFNGRPVIDEHGARLGRVTDVVFDARGSDPEYLVVDPGPLRKAHYVPVRGAYETIEGSIVVAWDKHWFKLAPKADRDHLLASVDRRLLEVHYAMTERPN